MPMSTAFTAFTSFTTHSSSGRTCVLGVGAGTAAALLATFVLVVQGHVAQAQQRHQAQALAQARTVASQAQQASMAAPVHRLASAGVQQQPAYSSLQRVQKTPRVAATSQVMTVALRTGGEAAAASPAR